MNENDLSDEAFDKYWAIHPGQQLGFCGHDVLVGWREAVRRAKANPWQLFEPQDLKAFLEALQDSGGDSGYKSWIEVELERRKAK